MRFLSLILQGQRIRLITFSLAEKHTVYIYIYDSLKSGFCWFGYVIYMFSHQALTCSNRLIIMQSPYRSSDIYDSASDDDTGSDTSHQILHSPETNARGLPNCIKSQLHSDIVHCGGIELANFKRIVAYNPSVYSLCNQKDKRKLQNLIAYWKKDPTSYSNAFFDTSLLTSVIGSPVARTGSFAGTPVQETSVRPPVLVTEETSVRPPVLEPEETERTEEKMTLESYRDLLEPHLTDGYLFKDIGTSYLLFTVNTFINYP